MNTTSIWKAIALLILCAFFWGSTFPIGKDALNEVSALTLVFWRFGIAAICLGLYLKATRAKIPHLSGKQWLWATTVSAVGIGGLNLCLFTGLEYTQATNGSLIMALSPLVTSFIACVAIRALPRKGQVFSLVVSLSGVLLVITDGQWDVLRNLNFNQGDQMIFTGMFAWSAYTFFSQGIGRWMPVIPYTFLGMLSGATVIGVMCAMTPNVHPFGEVITASPITVSELLYIGVLGTVAGYLLWLNGVRHLGSANAALFFNFVPVFAVLTAFLMGQAVSQIQVLGIAIVVAGLLLPRLPHPGRWRLALSRSA
ncbi:EamA family transporter [Salinivibrio sp. AR647]|jgi:drug/metabolite transporter (DMT)-like permease|uniref:DMT family transporter n=1 Tax=unclassified Salinivibrio TaxID=2636825 RepID=UPI000985351B|nr:MULTISPECIES: DMT family transporter [unclassified Salinivibrio]OOE92043.1 EamA family transporter [Salinivibrio sp. AR647]OOF03214.1 EamA family transporter [Salinivibrio sp. MA440]